MLFAFKTDKGLVKSANQDKIFINEKIGLFLIADGIGGHQAGDIASELAATLINKFIEKNIAIESNIEMLIQNSLAHANSEIFECSKDDSTLKGMGTTLALSLILNEKIYITNIGDSRVYIIKDNVIKQVSNDHTLVEDLIHAGEITREEAKKHRLRHVITKAMGTKNMYDVDIQTFDIDACDYILLCSDGLTDHISDEEIRDTILEKNQPSVSCDRLIDLANQRGGRDNISLIIIFLAKTLIEEGNGKQ